MRPRIGFGFDIHALKHGDFVTLGGVRIPHTQAIDAHSDGDVAIHALCDALLGALALGDIGHYFPPSDARWKNVDSRVLLRECVALIHARNFEVGNVDITVIAEAPKLASHVSLMQSRLAQDLMIETAHVSIKATTNEKLDAIGAKAGIAAHAVALLFAKP
jgi:2-C-methyl-D-erythritol 2,4-cyclodiphosphate synthase